MLPREILRQDLDRQGSGRALPRGRSLNVYTLTLTCTHTDVGIRKAIHGGTTNFT